MKRTQVYLPEELHEKIRRLSFDQRKSMAQVVRDAVASYVDVRSETTSLSFDDDLKPLGGETRDSMQDLSGRELEELRRNPLYDILGMVSRSYLRDRHESDDGQTPTSIPPCESS
ncbi:MAG TPA: CopG family transcriptional regulator [Anaerolineae bacterium]|nr:CopG family transcriptional regulator [Anaerolineae bacterium]